MCLFRLRERAITIKRNSVNSIYLYNFVNDSSRPIQRYKTWRDSTKLKIMMTSIPVFDGSVRVAERLTLSTSDHGVVGSNTAGGEILPEPKRRFIAQSLSCSPIHRPEMTEILLKGRKTLTHPAIRFSMNWPFWTYLALSECIYTFPNLKWKFMQFQGKKVSLPV